MEATARITTLDKERISRAHAIALYKGTTARTDGGAAAPAMATSALDHTTALEHTTAHDGATFHA